MTLYFFFHVSHGGGGIHKLRWQARGRVEFAKYQWYYIYICSKPVNEGGGGENFSKSSFVVYECSPPPPGRWILTSRKFFEKIQEIFGLYSEFRNKGQNLMIYRIRFRKQRHKFLNNSGKARTTNLWICNLKH